MKPHRFRILITGIISVLAFGAVLHSSCKKEEPDAPYVDTQCIDVNCNNGQCFKGECACTPGWEGFFCDIKTVDKYMGEWMALETITGSNDTTSTNAVGDTNSYIFRIIPNGNSVLTFRIAGLMNHQFDTVLGILGDPIDHYFERNSFYFESAALQAANVYLPGGGGRITSSGSVIDTMGYTRWYDGVNAHGDTIVLKEEVSVVAQKAP